MIRPGENVAAGVSGGPDSVCLLFLLKDICRELGARLYAVHVHHGLRGAEADGDESFVRELCAREQIPLRVFSYDVRERAARERLTLEEAGRLCRYEAFQEAASELGGARIAVAHHMDDQAETVLMHLLRGSGPDGAGGMDERSGDLYRPLLSTPRRALEQYLRERGVAWRTDRTNLSPDTPRNALR